MSDKITTSITNALAAANLINQLVTGVIDQSNSKLASENIFERKTQVVRSTSHLKRLMSQTWFTDALNIDQFTTINDAIVAGEEYTG
jgi:ubiquinone biosynthesis protein Coq4